MLRSERFPPAVSEPELSLLKRIFEAGTAAVCVKDGMGRYLLVTPAYAQMLDMEVAGLLGHRDAEVLTPAAAQTLEANDQAVLRSGRAAEHEERLTLAHRDLSLLTQRYPLAAGGRDGPALFAISTDVTDRDRTEQALRGVAFGVSSVTGTNVFPEIVRQLAAALDVDIAVVGKLTDDSDQRLETVAIYDTGQIVDNISYDLAGTPCEHVVGQEFRYIPGRVQQLYPGRNMLSQMGFESYAGYPLFDSAGQPLGLIAVVHRQPLRERALVESILRIYSVRASTEVERLSATRAREISEESYLTIFEATEDAIFVHDVDTGAVVDVNPRACEAYGYAYEELLRVDAGALSSGIPPYTSEEALRRIERAKGGETQRFEWHRRNRDGSLHWDEVFLKRATINGVPRVLAITREISQRRRAEAVLRATVDAALDCIIGIDSDGRVVEFNPAAERVFGYRREAMMGKSLAGLIVPERHRQAHQRGLAHYGATGEGAYLGQRVEVEAQRADGSEFPAELAISVAEGAEGSIFIGYLRDITERKAAEAERERLGAQLRQAQKMEAIGHLAGGIAHDFNNLLTGIMGYTTLALERVDGSQDEKLIRYLQRARRSGDRARDLIQQLLTFSRGQRGEPRALAMGPLVKETVKLLESMLPSSIEIDAQCEEGLPCVEVDPVHAEQVLVNLCVNARDAMQGRGRLSIALRRFDGLGSACASCRRPIGGEFLELAVSDTGTGIEPVVLERMFEPFFSTKGPGKGSGMGLATVHGIVHECAGHILVDSLIGQGSTLRVLLPLRFEESSEGERPPEEGARARPDSSLKGRILLVDDEPAVAEFMQDLLESWGLQVRVYHSGVEACEAFADDPEAVDMAILDQTMPKMNGLESARRLLERRPDLPAILYTGYSEGLTEAIVAQAGLRALLRKPIDEAQLRDLLQELLRWPSPPG
jgi:PAS domain S-box-containing protein